jgi:cytochrome c biogenesis protein CcmG, thiol:disulfide interchange protein DsbE
VKLRYVVPVVILVALLAFLAGGLTRDPREVPSPLIGKPMPAFSLPGLNGEPPRVTERDLQGRPLLVNFFASWCAACQIEHPLFMRLAQEGVEIVGVDWKDDDAAGSKWLQRHGNPYRLVLSDRANVAGLDWGVYGAPETYVIDARGVIVYKRVGPVTEEIWRENIAPLFTKAAS